jgi:hypothetical protein
MKNKGSSLYEVLKSASRPQGEAAGAAAPSDPPPRPSEGGPLTLQERLAAYKAAKLAQAGASAATAEATPPPAPAPAEPTADPTPPPAAPAPAAPVATTVQAAPRPVETPRAAEPPPPAGPGERVLRVTYNTLVFAGLVGVGLFFIAYALGVKSGRSRAAESASEALRAAAPAPVLPPAPAPAPAPAPRKEYTIRLAEWRYVTARDRMTAEAEAEDLKKALDKAGYKGVEKLKIERSGELRLALYTDRLADVASASARNRLATLQKFTFKNAKPLAQAAFEEVPR